jgi:hypothetical protein
MAKLRGLTHQIARLLLLAFCVSLLATISLSITPDPALARTSHIVQGPGDMGGGLEAKPDDWTAPTRQVLPVSHPIQGHQPTGLFLDFVRLVFSILGHWT